MTPTRDDLPALLAAVPTKAHLLLVGDVAA